MKPIGYYVSARSDHPDAAILDRIQEEFGGQLEALTNDDKAAVLVCLIEEAISPQQVLIAPHFFSDTNGWLFWRLAQQLSSDNQLTLALAILNQVVDGVRK